MELQRMICMLEKAFYVVDLLNIYINSQNLDAHKM